MKKHIFNNVLITIGIVISMVLLKPWIVSCDTIFEILRLAMAIALPWGIISGLEITKFQEEVQIVVIEKGEP